MSHCLTTIPISQLAACQAEESDKQLQEDCIKLIEVSDGAWSTANSYLLNSVPSRASKLSVSDAQAFCSEMRAGAELFDRIRDHQQHVDAMITAWANGDEEVPSDNDARGPAAEATTTITVAFGDSQNGAVTANR